MKPVTWYNIPEKPDTIFGPATVFPAQSGVKYKVSPIDNATSYRWILSTGISGSSESSEIGLSFNEHFQSGKISVTAVNDGFGESDPVELKIKTDDDTFGKTTPVDTKIEILPGQNFILIKFLSVQYQKVSVKIYDQWGRTVFSDIISINSGFDSVSINKNTIGKGLFVISFQFENEFITKKIIVI
jgi:hypothetical protein